MTKLRLVVVFLFLVSVVLIVIFPSWEASARETRRVRQSEEWVTVTYKGIIGRGTPIWATFTGPSNFTLRDQSTGDLTAMFGSGEGTLHIRFEAVKRVHCEEPTEVRDSNYYLRASSGSPRNTKPETEDADYCSWGVNVPRTVLECAGLLVLMSVLVFIIGPGKKASDKRSATGVHEEEGRTSESSFKESQARGNPVL